MNTHETLDRKLLDLTEGKTVVLTGHTRPDPDCVGTILALGEWFRLHGREVVMHLPEEPLGRWFNKLELRRKFRFGAIDPVYLENGVVIAVDVPTPKLCVADHVDFVVDHHPRSQEAWGIDGYYCEAPAMAAGLFDLLVDWIGSRPIAMGVYLAIYGDTGGFQFGNTNWVCHAAAAMATHACPDLPARVAKAVNELDLDTVVKVGEAMASLEEVRPGVVFGVTRHPVAARQLSQYLGCDVLVLEAEIGSKKTLMLRSPSGAVNVSEIAKKLGGGGHPAAAGAPWCEDWREKVLAALD